MTEKPIIYVKPIRKDGLYPIQCLYPVSGHKHIELMSSENLEQKRASGEYEIKATKYYRR